MSARSAFSVVVVVRDLLARGDFAGPGASRLVALHRQARPLEGSLGDLVRAAIRPGGRLSGSVWVVTDELFSQILTLPAGAVGDLDGPALARALAYEAQALSGLAAQDSVLDWCELPSGGHERAFWVALASRGERDDLAATVHELGGRLAGVCHPAGVPRRLVSGAPGAPWLRTERWHDLAATVTGNGSSPVAVRVRSATDRRRPGGEAEPEATEQLEAVAGASPGDGRAPAVLRLGDEATFGRWLAAWAASLAEGALPVPVLRPAVVPTSRIARVARSTAFAVAIGCGAWLHHASVEDEREACARELARVTAPSLRVAAIDRERTALGREALELRAATAFLGSGTHLPDRLMEAVAVHRPAGLVVETLDLGWERSVVGGSCVEPSLVDRLAGALALEVAGDQRRVTPRAKRYRSEGDAAGLYEFELEVSPPPAGLATRPLATSNAE